MLKDFLTRVAWRGVDRHRDRLLGLAGREGQRVAGDRDVVEARLAVPSAVE